MKNLPGFTADASLGHVRIAHSGSKGLATEGQVALATATCYKPHKPPQPCLVRGGWQWCGCGDASGLGPRGWVCGGFCE